MKLFTYPGNFRAFKALIAAEYNGVSIEVPDFKPVCCSQYPVLNRFVAHMPQRPGSTCRRPVWPVRAVHGANSVLCETWHTFTADNVPGRHSDTHRANICLRTPAHACRTPPTFQSFRRAC